MMRVHVEDDKLKQMTWACREIISSMSETADDIYKEVRMFLAISLRRFSFDMVSTS